MVPSQCCFCWWSVLPRKPPQEDPWAGAVCCDWCASGVFKRCLAPAESSSCRRCWMRSPGGHWSSHWQLVLRSSGQLKGGCATSPGEGLCESWRGGKLKIPEGGIGCHGFHRLLGMLGLTRSFVALGVGLVLTAELFIFSSSYCKYNRLDP